MKPTFDLSVLTSRALERFRSVTDPMADEVIARIIDSGSKEHVNQVFMTLVRSGDFNKKTFSGFPPELSGILNDYFTEAMRLPEWADQAKLKVGEDLFLTYGPEVFMLLNVSSLPMCYTCAKGARVLFDTGRLLVRNQDMDPLARRLMETAQMVVDVMSPGGLSLNGAGLLTIARVRLIHASIRYYLKHGQASGKRWQEETLGEPINQEDLLGTLMSFGPVILSGLERLSIQLKPAEQEAWMHCWKVIGHLMGIDQALLPDTYEDGLEVANRILIHQADESEAGKALTASCVQFIQYTLPGNAFEGLPDYLINYFLTGFSRRSGKDLSECIGLDITAEHQERLALTLSRFVTGELGQLESHAFVRRVTEPFNRLLLQGIIHHYNSGKGVHFFIPPSLQQNWGLRAGWKDFRFTPNLFGNRLSWQKQHQTIINKP